MKTKEVVIGQTYYTNSGADLIPVIVVEKVESLKLDGGMRAALRTENRKFGC